ncbi:MAG: mismatch-specific DNA-glycosylase [Syntrophomonas sp.]
MVEIPGLVPDYLSHGLRIVFVGFNPSLRSGETGHHFANPSNRFWRILYEAGLTPRIYSPEEDHLLLQLGYGLTNIVPCPTRAAADIMPEEYVGGRQLLSQKLKHYRPLTVCYVGKGVYQAYSQRTRAPWGYQPFDVIDGARDFVAPSSSGLVRMKTSEIVAIYRQLFTAGS